MPFTDLKLDPSLLKAIKELGYTRPTPVQEETIPHILAGEDPVKVSLIGSVILLAATLYLTYGWNLKTHASVVSIMASLLITGALSLFFVYLTRLTGYGD